MAYIPRLNLEQNRLQPGLAAIGAPAAGGGGAPAVATPAPSSGGSFSALRSFFDANQPQMNAQVDAALKPVEAQTYAAKNTSEAAAATPENRGGRGLVDDAIATRDDALSKVQALGSDAGRQAILEQNNPGAGYTAGMKAADGYMFGRAPGIEDKRAGWEGVLSALNPQAAPAYTERPPPERPTPRPADPRGGPRGAGPGPGSTRRNPVTGETEVMNREGDWIPQRRPGIGGGG